MDQPLYIIAGKVIRDIHLWRGVQVATSLPAHVTYMTLGDPSSRGSPSSQVVTDLVRMLLGGEDRIRGCVTQRMVCMLSAFRETIQRKA